MECWCLSPNLTKNQYDRIIFQHHELSSSSLLKIAKEYGSLAFHSCGDCTRWIDDVRKIKNLLMIDGAFSEQTDPGAINNIESFHVFADDEIVLNARIVGDLETISEKVKRLWVPGMKLIVVTYCQTPEEQ